MMQLITLFLVIAYLIAGLIALACFATRAAKPAWRYAGLVAALLWPIAGYTVLMISLPPSPPSFWSWYWAGFIYGAPPYGVWVVTCILLYLAVRRQTRIRENSGISL
jgi:ribose/xylose/arabinose/galactoside ABC-type transport system permease subunit